MNDLQRWYNTVSEWAWELKDSRGRVEKVFAHARDVAGARAMKVAIVQQLRENMT